MLRLPLRSVCDAVPRSERPRAGERGTVRSGRFRQQGRKGQDAPYARRRLMRYEKSRGRYVVAVQRRQTRPERDSSVTRAESVAGLRRRGAEARPMRKHTDASRRRAPTPRTDADLTQGGAHYARRGLGAGAVEARGPRGRGLTKPVSRSCAARTRRRRCTRIDTKSAAAAFAVTVFSKCTCNAPGPLADAAGDARVHW